VDILELMMLIRDLDAGKYAGWAFVSAHRDSEANQYTMFVSRTDGASKGQRFIGSRGNLEYMLGVWAAGKTEGQAEAATTTQDTASPVEATSAAS
jgi:hypothetical protein